MPLYCRRSSSTVSCWVWYLVGQNHTAVTQAGSYCIYNMLAPSIWDPREPSDADTTQGETQTCRPSQYGVVKDETEMN